ncbi:MAG: hypothetical protein GXY07_20450 [Candidatus Hydrogenedentes bacterium]|nr:hypothetical protein [Candidatus Hydrogenedentota bacterium]
MQLTVLVFMAAALLGAPETVTSLAPAPTTIGMYTNYWHGWARDDAPVDCVLIPVAAYQEGKWQPSAFFAMEIPGGPNVLAETFRPEQEAFLDVLMTQTFYLCSNLATTFTPEKKKIPWKVEQQYIGLAGTVKGNLDVEDKYFDLPMTNVPDVIIPLEKASLSVKEKALLADRAKELISAEVIERESEIPKDKERPAFQPERYDPPEYVHLLKFKLPNDREGLWVHATMAYPFKEGPEEFGFFKRSYWCGYYHALVERGGEKSEDKILWEYASFIGRETESRYYDLKGVFDADKDDKPEFLFDVGGWEYGEYMLVHAENWELVKVSSLFGAL